MDGSTPWIIAALIALFGPVGTYLVARNQTASELKKAATAAAAELEKSNATILDQREARIYAEQERIYAKLEAELGHRVEAQEEASKTCKAEIERLTAEIVALRLANAELHAGNQRLATELAALVKVVSQTQRQPAAPDPVPAAPDSPTVVGDIAAETIVTETLQVTDQQAATIAEQVSEAAGKKAVNGPKAGRGG